MALIKCSECNKEISDKAKMCIHCGCPVSEIKQDDSRILKDKLENIINTNEQVRAIKEIRDITGLGLKEAFNLYTNYPESLNELENINYTNPGNKVSSCPKCGSTDFEMVQRKWGLMTGFLTNKVDRVCRNCKNRF